MRSVKESVQRWESQNHVQEVTNPTYNQGRSSGVGTSDGFIPNRQSVAIGNRLTEMEEAKKLLEAMQIKTNNSNLIPGNYPPRHSINAGGQNRASLNPNLKSRNQQDSLTTSNYQKQFLNIRGTLNMDMRNEPPVPRNTVDVNYNDNILKPSKVRESQAISNKYHQVDQSVNNNSLSPHGPYFRPMQNSTFQPFKSQLIRVDKETHYRTQKIIDTLFGPQEYDEFGYSKAAPATVAVRMTNAAQSLEKSGIPKYKSQGIPLKGIIKNKGKKHHQDFDNL